MKKKCCIPLWLSISSCWAHPFTQQRLYLGIKSDGLLLTEVVAMKGCVRTNGYGISYYIKRDIVSDSNVILKRELKYNVTFRFSTLPIKALRMLSG